MRQVSDELRQLKTSIFQALSHPARIAIVEALREGGLTAGTLIKRLGLEQANVAQHLAVLRAHLIVMKRKDGNQMFYCVRDPVLLDILDVLCDYVQAQLSEELTVLQKLNQEDKTG